MFLEGLAGDSLDDHSQKNVVRVGVVVTLTGLARRLISILGGKSDQFRRRPDASRVGLRTDDRCEVVHIVVGCVDATGVIQELRNRDALGVRNLSDGFAQRGGQRQFVVIDLGATRQQL